MYDDITQFLACSATRDDGNNKITGYSGHIYEGTVHVKGVDGQMINKTRHFTLMAAKIDQPCEGQMAGILGIGPSAVAPAYEHVRANPTVFLSGGCVGHNLTDAVPSFREEAFGVTHSLIDSLTD